MSKSSKNFALTFLLIVLVLVFGFIFYDIYKTNEKEIPEKEKLVTVEQWEQNGTIYKIQYDEETKAEYLISSGFYEGGEDEFNFYFKNFLEEKGFVRAYGQWTIVVGND